MIINLIQTRSSFGADFVFSNSASQVIYTASIRLAIGNLDMRLMKNEEPVLISNSGKSQLVNNFGKNSPEKEYGILNILKPDGEICAKICSKRVRKFFAGYKYYEIDYNGDEFTCYEVGRGKEGLFVLIYIGERQVAMIEKPPLVHDNKDCYTIYTIDSKYNDIISFFVLYYDHGSSGNYNEVVYKKKEVKYVYTMNKELKSKYNPRFKELC